MASPEVITAVTQEDMGTTVGLIEPTGQEENFKPFAVQDQNGTMLVHITPDKTLLFCPATQNKQNRREVAIMFMGDVLKGIGLNGIPEEDKEVVRSYLGMDDGIPKAQRQVATDLGMKAWEVSEIFNSALGKLGCSELYRSLLDFSKRPLKVHPNNLSTLDVQETVGGEETLIRKAQGGDEEAFNTLYGSYYPRVYRFMLPRVDNETDAEDVASEAILKVFNDLPNYESKGLPFVAWVFRIARNTIISRHRRLGGVETTEIPFNLADKKQTPEEEVVERIGNQQELARIYNALPHLASKGRAVVVLRFFRGFTLKETAEVLGISVENVKVTQHQAVENLKGILSDEHPKTKRERTSPLQDRILRVLIQNVGKPIPTGQLAWQVNTSSGSVTSSIYNLREKGVPIKNQYGAGYYIEIEK